MPHADEVLVEVDNISLDAHLFERYILLTDRSLQLRSIMIPNRAPICETRPLLQPRRRCCPVFRLVGGGGRPILCRLHARMARGPTSGSHCCILGWEFTYLPPNAYDFPDFTKL